MPYQGKAKTEGGVYVPDQAKDREARATVVAYGSSWTTSLSGSGQVWS